jgi:hypothetical protein
MTRRQWLRRRLLWAGVLLGLLLVFAAVEVLRAALAAGDAIGRLAAPVGRRGRRLAY